MITKAHISDGNIKTGAIRSASLPPRVTCPVCECWHKCYAEKICRLRPNVRRSYDENLEFYRADPAGYFESIEREILKRGDRFFRFHVSGDIPDRRYFVCMADLADVLPDTTFLVFTKRYAYVNDYIIGGGRIPSNLKIIFSAWSHYTRPENPYNLPVAEVVLKGETPAPDWFRCGGNCTRCAACGVGCWALKNGQTIAFYEH